MDISKDDLRAGHGVSGPVAEHGSHAKTDSPVSDIKDASVPKKKESGFSAWQALILILVIVIAVIGVVYYIFVGPQPSRSTEWQAVFLTNGQVYFGHISSENNREITLEDIYYLQISNPLQQDGQPAPKGELSLVKLGNELHGPKDIMFINRDQVLFTEDLRDDGKVVGAILRHKAGAEN